MRELNAVKIELAVKQLFLKAATELPEDISRCLKKACRSESNEMAATVLCSLCDNAEYAKRNGIPICQDTGMAFVFAEIGQEIHINGNFETAVNNGVKSAYIEGNLRLSVAEPLSRINTGSNTPAVLYTKLVDGDRLKITAMPKGFGSENMSQLKMFNPTATVEDIKAFVVDTVKRAGANPCPPIIVGVGIGGSFDYSAFLSKKALTREIGQYNEAYANLEKELIAEINKTGIGPQGFGGNTTCLWVAVETAPTHIAGLPVAVNISCHATRHKSITL